METFGVIMALTLSGVIGVGLSAAGLRLLLTLMPAKEAAGELTPPPV